jgi:hypothetical protein
MLADDQHHPQAVGVVGVLGVVPARRIAAGMTDALDVAQGPEQTGAEQVERNVEPRFIDDRVDLGVTMVLLENFTPMSRLIWPTQTFCPFNVTGARHSRMWLRLSTLPRAFCSAMSCGRPNMYSGDTGEVR